MIGRIAAYHDLLALWKDADPRIPILKRAKAEYATLQWPRDYGKAFLAHRKEKNSSQPWQSSHIPTPRLQHLPYAEKKYS